MTDTVFSLKTIMAKTRQEDGCRLWLGGFVRGRWPRMYAVIGGRETAVSARPVVWRLSGGRELERGEVLAMRCGNDACLLHAHMEVIDKGEVSRRNWAKPGAKLRRSIANQIASRGKAKLDMEKAREMRSKRAEGRTQESLAEEFGISQALASRVVRGESWKEYGTLVQLWGRP